MALVKPSSEMREIIRALRWSSESAEWSARIKPEQARILLLVLEDYYRRINVQA